MRAAEQDFLFAEDQSFRQPWLWGPMLGTLLLLVTFFVLILVDDLAREGTRQALMGIGIGIVVTASVAVLMFVMKLSVKLDAQALHIRFFPLVSRDIALGTIASWAARTYRPIWEYGGWGIRCSWKGMAFNVSGNRGVQLEVTNGKRLLIGSQCPEALAAAISRAKETA